MLQRDSLQRWLWVCLGLVGWSAFVLLGCSATRSHPAAHEPRAGRAPPEPQVPRAAPVLGEGARRKTEKEAATMASSVGAEAALPPALEMEQGAMRSVDDALTPARTEADYGCRHATDARLSPPLRLLQVSQPVRLWASTGPDFPVSLVTRRALLSVTTTGDSPALLACGGQVAVDLAPGRYWIRGQTRSAFQVGSGDSAAAPGFVYRLAQPGDSACPVELATRGIHDWDGEFPYEVHADERIDADAKPDVRIEYQAGYTSAGTRLLVSVPYPACFRVVAEAPALVRALPNRRAGFRDYRWTFRPLHPVEIWGGRVFAEYDAHYSPDSAMYEQGRFTACHEALPSESGWADRERERWCERWLRALAPMSVPNALVASWLDAAPSERARVPSSASLASAATVALLRGLDSEGFSAELSGGSACAPAPRRVDFVFRVKLHPPAAALKHEVFVLATRRPGRHDEIAGVFAESPCAAEDVPDELEAFQEAWREQPWSDARRSSSDAPGIARAHAALRRASRSERLDGVELSTCATSPEAPAPTWLVAARLRPEPQLADVASVLPSYFIVGRRGASFVVLSATDVRPAHC